MAINKSIVLKAMHSSPEDIPVEQHDINLFIFHSMKPSFMIPMFKLKFDIGPVVTAGIKYNRMFRVLLYKPIHDS